MRYAFVVVVVVVVLLSLILEESAQSRVRFCVCSWFIVGDGGGGVCILPMVTLTADESHPGSIK